MGLSAKKISLRTAANHQSLPFATGRAVAIAHARFRPNPASWVLLQPFSRLMGRSPATPAPLIGGRRRARIVGQSLTNYRPSTQRLPRRGSEPHLHCVVVDESMHAGQGGPFGRTCVCPGKDRQRRGATEGEERGSECKWYPAARHAADDKHQAADQPKAQGSQDDVGQGPNQNYDRVAKQDPEHARSSHGAS